MLAHHDDHANDHDHGHGHGHDGGQDGRTRDGAHASGRRAEGPRLPRGREANHMFWQDFFNAVPDARIVLEALAVSGDEVLGRMMLHGRHTGDHLGIPATGRTLRLREVDIWHVSDSVLAGRWDDLRDTELFRQLSSMNRPEDPTAPTAC